MTKPHQEDQAELFFITEAVAAELTAAGYEFAPLVTRERRASASCLAGTRVRRYSRL
jgi:hypothetical protein